MIIVIKLFYIKLNYSSKEKITFNLKNKFFNKLFCILLAFICKRLHKIVTNGKKKLIFKAEIRCCYWEFLID